MEISDAYQPPKNKPLPPLKPPKASRLIRRIIGWGLALLVIGVLVGMLLPGVSRRVPEAARRVQCLNNMRQIALAMHNYESVYGHLPPAYIADENGNPMHSWRVLILPFMEKNNLFERYSMDEPWDGPNNRLLADEIDWVYRCPTHDTHEGEENSTQYCLVTGEGTLFQADRAPSFSDIKDGSSNTVILVEVNRGDIHWMEPRDLTLDEAIGVFEQAANGDTTSHHTGIQNVAFADTSTESLTTSTSRAQLMKLFLVADESSD
jgi:type II secretory pathway pseudopilin PulG